MAANIFSISGDEVNSLAEFMRKEKKTSGTIFYITLRFLVKMMGNIWFLIINHLKMFLLKIRLLKTYVLFVVFLINAFSWGQYLMIVSLLIANS